jgi:hypothetical protein
VAKFYQYGQKAGVSLCTFEIVRRKGHQFCADKEGLGDALLQGLPLIAASGPIYSFQGSHSRIEEGCGSIELDFLQMNTPFDNPSFVGRFCEDILQAVADHAHDVSRRNHAGFLNEHVGDAICAADEGTYFSGSSGITWGFFIG